MFSFSPSMQFAPVRLDTFAAGTWFLTMVFGCAVGTTFYFYLFTTRLWPLALLYTLWLFSDRNQHEQGGRPILWVEKWRWWYHAKHYFPSKLVLSPNFRLDSDRNYLFCCFPHGVFPTGPYHNILSYHSEFRTKYPDFRVLAVVLTMQFFMPFLRDLALAVGCISSTATSINWALGQPGGGHIALLMVGGAQEAYYAGRYKFVVKVRKGFARLALQNGAPLVPVISFGECELFDQVDVPVLREFQDLVRKWVGFVPVIFSGRGFFQDSVGLIPRKKPVVTVVGAPIEVPKVPKPTGKQIEELHKKFVRGLVDLFEEHKHEYLERPEEQFLELL